VSGEGAGAPAVAYVALARLRTHPDNVRRDLGDLRELVASIRRHGVLQPLRVEHRAGAGFARIRAGHRRAAAAMLAGVSKVPCVIVPEAGTDEAIAEMFAENLHRAGLTTVEKRDNARRLITEFGYTVEAIATAIGAHPSTVYGWLRSTPRPAQHPRIRPRALHELVTRWRRAAGDGLDAEQAGALLSEVADLLGGWTPAASTTQGSDAAQAHEPMTQNNHEGRQ